MNTIKLGLLNPIRNVPEIPKWEGDLKKKSIEWQPLVLFIVLLSIWFPMHQWLRKIDPTISTSDQSMWLLILLSIMAFLLMVALSSWLLQLFWQWADLPSLLNMVSQFKTLTLWQQLGFYWASFFSLLAVASACLIAIC